MTAGSPAERAGLKPYDLITAVDGIDVIANDALIREISARTPGSTARLDVIRDGREHQLLVKLAERQPAARPTDYAQRGPSNRVQPRASVLAISA